ncbi:unnamed protein product [Nesidiocoris tenuis]|uniref:PDZ domain-containing protein n=1 Tax=Nesidiocoris tenuis TaxID=355587 RepID=A0A6H5G3H3_9HEMI|nr:unnamed protein product [Nesidiocoris tenuis]
MRCSCGALQVGDRILTANGRPVSERISRLEDLGSSGIDQDFPDWNGDTTRESIDTSYTATSPTQQSDDEETCSSLRLSESVADGLGEGRPSQPVPPPPPSPPCPLQTNYRLRKVNLPAHWRGSSTNTAMLDPVEQAQTPQNFPVEVEPVASFSTFRTPKPPPSHNREPSVTHSIFQTDAQTIVQKVILSKATSKPITCKRFYPNFHAGFQF